MKKKKIQYITRNVIISDITTIGINTVTMQVERRHFLLSGSYEPDEHTLMIVKIENDDNSYLPSAIFNIEKTEELRAMSVDDFIKHSKKIPPRAKISTILYNKNPPAFMG